MGVHGTFDLAGNVAIDIREGLRGSQSLWGMLSPRVAGNADCASSAPALSRDFCFFSVCQYNSILILDIPVSILVCYLALVSEYLANCSPGFSLFSCTLG